MTTLALSIIVVSYNTREMTLACLRSVFEQTRNTPFELLVIDNQSSDGSADAIEAEFGGRLMLVRSEENLGFARANNVMAQRATGRYILLLNPDTVVLDGAIDRLMAFAAQRPQAGIWGGRTVFGDRSLNPTSCWRRQTLWSLVCHATALSAVFRGSSLFNPEGMGGWKRDSEREVDIVTGCFFLIERSFWERLGGFDPAFFMYGEEADLCLRARRLGVRPRITPKATIVHYGGASEPVRADKVVRLLSAKSRLLVRHWSGLLEPLGQFMLFMWCWSRWSLLSILGVFNPQQRKNAEDWGSIWRRRQEWVAREPRVASDSADLAAHAANS